MVIPVMTQHYAMLHVTSGKRLVVLVGQKKAIAIAVRNASGRRRWSKLDNCLGEMRLLAMPRGPQGASRR